MPANCISRLLLFVSVCAVWEALAKSLPDQGALGKLAIRGMRHNEEMGVVAFLRLLSTISRSVQRCALILWQPERYLRLITGEAFCRACPGIASSFGGIDSLISASCFDREATLVAVSWLCPRAVQMWEIQMWAQARVCCSCAVSGPTKPGLHVCHCCFAQWVTVRAGGPAVLEMCQSLSQHFRFLHSKINSPAWEHRPPLLFR